MGAEMSDKPASNWKYFLTKHLKVMVVLGILALLAIPMIEMMYILGLQGLISYFSSKVTNTTGVNPYLAKAVVMVLAIPLLWSFRWTFSFRSSRRIAGYAIVGCYILFFYISMFIMTREQKFDFSTGKSMKFYAVTPEGTRYFDAPGFDPKYGIPLTPVDPKVARKEGLEKRPPRKLDAPAQFFDFATGSPVVWYYVIPGGTLEFFDQPGHHPKYYEELKPITPEIVQKYEADTKFKEEERKLKAEEELRKSRLEEERHRQEIERKRQEEAQRQKAEIERKAQEAERKRLEEERLIALKKAEEKRLEQERLLKIEQERQRQLAEQEERKRKIEQERLAKQAERQRLNEERRQERQARIEARRLQRQGMSPNQPKVLIAVRNQLSIPVQLASGEFTGVTLNPGEVSSSKHVPIGAHKLKFIWKDENGRLRNQDINNIITSSTSLIYIQATGRQSGSSRRRGSFRF